MFATGSLARRIERADATLIADGAAAASLRLPSEDVMVVPLAGGVAAFIEPGSPFNKIAGLFTRRGYELVGFENVLGLSLDDRTLERRRMAAGESAIEVTHADAGESRAWSDAFADEVEDLRAPHRSRDRS